MMRGSFFGSVGDIFLALIILLEFKMDLNSIRDAANIMGRLFHFSSPPIEAAQTMEIDMSTGSIKVFDIDQILMLNTQLMGNQILLLNL